MFKKTTAALVVAAVAALAGCGTVPLGNTGTATIRVEFTEHNANVTSQGGASCNTPCALLYTVDLSRKDVLINNNVTYIWPSGATQEMRVEIRRSDVNRLGRTLAFALPPNINTAERLTTNRAPAAQAPEKSLLGAAIEGWNESAAERKRNAPVRCTTTHSLLGISSETTCR